MGDVFKKLGVELWTRVILSYKSTLLGLLCLAGGVAVDTFTTYLQSQPHLGAAVGSLLFILLGLAKKKLAEGAAVLQMPPPKGFAFVRVMLVCAALAALLGYKVARAQEAQPTGILPSAGVCNGKGTVCLQPAVTVVPILIDFKSGNVSRNIGFGFGYGVVFPRVFNSTSFTPGIDFLGGVQTGGGWIAALMPRLGVLRVGPVVSHLPGVTYAGLGVGTGM